MVLLIEYGKKLGLGVGGHCPLPLRSQVKFQMPTVSLSNISSYAIILVKVLFWIY